MTMITMKSLADAWERSVVLACYGHAPLTIGWWRGQAFVRVWDYKRGHVVWREFATRRAEQPPPRRNIFESTIWTKGEWMR